MVINQIISKRFAELAEEGKKIPIKQSPEGEHSNGVEWEAFQKWASSAMHLVASVFGEESPHYRNLDRVYKAFKGWAYELPSVRGVFLAAKSDYDGSYLFSLERAIAGEVFGDFVTSAKRALEEGQKDVAAVLACAALEDALKRFALFHGLGAGDNMSDVINALKSAGQLSGPQKSLVEAMPRIRNAAMHADWNKITAENVGSVLGFVEQFLLTKFS